MSSLTKNQQFLIRYVIGNDMQRARQMVDGVLAEDTTQKDAAFVSEMKERLARAQEMPLAYKGYLTGGYVSDEEMQRYFCSDREKAVAETIIRMSRAAEKLEELQIHYTNATLLYGPSGCGKTMFAKYLAYTMGRPLYYVNFASTVDSLMGQTAKNITKVFQAAASVPCVLFLDEIDCVALTRDAHGQKGPDGELERTTISLMQCLDTLPNRVVLLAATNRPDIIDPALMRRFSQRHKIQMPTDEEAVKMVELFFSSIGQENPYSDEEIRNLYREALTPAMLMVGIVQRLAEQIAQEEGDKPC